VYYSVDTIKLILPVNSDWIGQVQGFFTRTDSWHWCRFNPSTGELALLNLRTQIKPKSWHKGIYIGYREQTGFGPSIICEFSLPKAVYGNNVGLRPWWQSDLMKVAGCIERYLVSSIDPSNEQSSPLFPELGEWGVMRLDLAWAWRFESQKKAHAALDCLKNFRFRWRQPVFYPTGIFYPSRTSACKFYLKHEEFLKHDLKGLSECEQVSQNAVESVRRQSEGILRFEVTLRGRKLKELGVRLVSDLDAVDLGEILKLFLSRCTWMDGIYLSEADIADKLSSVYSKAKTARLLDFCRVLSVEGESFAIRRYGSDAYYRNKRDLRSVLSESGLSEITYELDGKDCFKFDTFLLPPDLQVISVFEYDPF